MGTHLSLLSTVRLRKSVACLFPCLQVIAILKHDANLSSIQLKLPYPQESEFSEFLFLSLNIT